MRLRSGHLATRTVHSPRRSPRSQARSVNRLITAALGLAVAAAAAGCGSKVPILRPNQNLRPVLELTRAPHNESTRFEYSYRMNWLGHDPDGRIDHYRYAIDPPAPDAFNSNPDTAWVLTDPPPSDRGRAFVPPSVLIRWTGTDEDGILNSQKPNQYRFILLDNTTPVTADSARIAPNSVPRHYAPLNWAGWDSSGADTTFKRYTDLTPGKDYMFCVIAIDEAGAYSPIFSQNTNMLNMRVTFAAQGGPRLSVWSDVFFYRYNPAVYSLLPQHQIVIEESANQRITFNWIGETEGGAAVRGYRWALDIEDVADQTPRSNERTDTAHWSQESSLLTSATVGPFEGGRSHFFYIEAVDNNGLKSLAVVNFSVVQSTFEHPLLVVNDTRRPLEELDPVTRCTRRPVGRWPMSAELDTFLFARGGNPWRCYPAGITTSPGIFAGYELGMLGTRTGRSDVRVTLATLGRYRHVIWITDAKGGLNDDPGTSISSPIGALRYMSVPGRANSLAAYITQGGEVWLVGGGAAYASMIPYNLVNNDNTNPAPGKTFSFANNELIAGRFMFDVFHWQSEIKVSPGPIMVRRHLGRHDSAGTGPTAYRQLPAQMRPKSTALGDEFPPYRTRNLGDFYLSNFDVEYLSQANRILEDVDPSLLGFDEQSTLDTLYAAVGNSLMPPQFNRANVCMTRYVGPAYTPVIFTGFDIWTWSRVDCKAIVDAVLQRMWGMPYTPPAPRPAAVPSPAAAIPRRSE